MIQLHEAIKQILLSLVAKQKTNFVSLCYDKYTLLLFYFIYFLLYNTYRSTNMSVKSNFCRHAILHYTEKTY